MTKRHADSMADISPTDANHPWVARGYRPDFAYSVREAPIQDPYGEIAYQRAFFEAAEAKSRRVPDPVLYHNSPSAKEYIERRDGVIFAVKPRYPHNKSSTQPNTPSSSGTPTYSPGKLPSPDYTMFPRQRAIRKPNIELVPPIPSTSATNRNAQRFSPNPLGSPAEQYRPYALNGLPLTLEPKLDGPSGPSRMLR